MLHHETGQAVSALNLVTEDRRGVAR